MTTSGVSHYNYSTKAATIDKNVYGAQYWSASEMQFIRELILMNEKRLQTENSTPHELRGEALLIITYNALLKDVLKKRHIH